MRTKKDTAKLVEHVVSDRVLGITLSGKKSPFAFVFDSVKTANSTGNGYAVYKTPEDIAKDVRKVHIEDIFELRNKIVPPKDRWGSLNDISTRIEGAWRLWEDAIKYLPVVTMSIKEMDMAKKKEVVAETTKKGKAANGEAAERKPRESGFEGKRLTAKVTLEDSGRREGSEVHTALKIIADAGKKGIKYEDYVAKGGSAKFVTWCLNKEHITAA